MRIVVSDTSPIRALAHLQATDWLADWFEQILVPPAVAAELSIATRRFPALNVLSLRGVQVQAPASTPRLDQLRTSLDPGEAEAIELALDVGADGILIDESRGRLEAERFGLRTVGVFGLLLRAKSDGRVEHVLPLLDRLRVEVDFFISDRFRARIAELAGEL